ncbi:MAG: LuxR C-terminal-related transcriptional regulator [Chloroflexota bacterium]
MGAIQADDGLFVTDADQRIVAWSESAELLFGRASEDVIGRPCHEVLGALDRQPPCVPGCRPILEARRGRAIAHPDMAARHADGRLMHIRLSTFVTHHGRVDEVGVAGRRDPNGAPDALPLLVHLARPRTVAGHGSLAGRVADVAPGTQSDEIPPFVNPLSPRELEVLGLLSTGRTTRQIAERLTISPFTARNHILSIERKLGAHSRVEMIYHAALNGLL